MAISKINGVELYYELHGEGEDVLVLNNGVIASTGLSRRISAASLTVAN